MRWTSEQFSEDLEKVKQNIESEMVGLQVVASNSWVYPLEKQCVNYLISSQQKMTILEEFVLKIISQNRKGHVDNQTIGALLGLDPVFIDTCTDDLIKKDMLNSVFELTEIGKLLFKQNTVPGPSSHEKIEYYFDRIFGHVYAEWIETDIVSICPHIVDIQAAFTKKTKFVNRKFLENAGQIVGKVIEQPSLGIVVTKIQAIDIVERVNTLMSEIWIYDVIEDLLSCRVWDHARQTYNFEIGDFFQRNYSSDIKKKYELANVKIDHELRQALEHWRTTKYMTSSFQQDDLVRLYRGAEIKPCFLDCLNEATSQVIIFSPWISSNVFDNALLELFRKLASSNIGIALGWGFNEQIDQEKPMDPLLIKELHSIRNSYGDPKVCLIHIGNRHEKEVVIDDRIHLSGSFNWLSYRGDNNPRGESIYMIRDPEIVLKQKIYWENVFTNKILSNIHQVEDHNQLTSELKFLSNHMEMQDYDRLLKELQAEAL